MKILVGGRENDFANTIEWAIVENDREGVIEQVEYVSNKTVKAFAKLLEFLVERKILTIEEAYNEICSGHKIIEEIK